MQFWSVSIDKILLFKIKISKENTSAKVNVSFIHLQVFKGVWNPKLQLVNRRFGKEYDHVLNLFNLI